jgi:hypothetical protein
VWRRKRRDSAGGRWKKASQPKSDDGDNKWRWWRQVTTVTTSDDKWRQWRQVTTVTTSDDCDDRWRRWWWWWQVTTSDDGDDKWQRWRQVTTVTTGDDSDDGDDQVTTITTISCVGLSCFNPNRFVCLYTYFNHQLWLNIPLSESITHKKFTKIIITLSLLPSRQQIEWDDQTATALPTNWCKIPCFPTLADHPGHTCPQDKPFVAVASLW